MSTSQRGLIIFAIMVIVGAVFCYALPFVIMPNAGLGVGLPAVSLPPEVLKGNVIPSFFGADLTNTMTSTIIVDVLLLLIGFTVYRAVTSTSPDRFVPKGLTNAIDALAEFWYDTTKNNIAGIHVGRVVPLALTVFLFLLIANWTKLIPGFETVGVITCADPGQSGYSLMSNNTHVLQVSGNLTERAGHKVTDDDFANCVKTYPQYIPAGVNAKLARGEAVDELGIPAGGTLADIGKANTQPAGQPTPGAQSTPAASGQGRDVLMSNTISGQPKQGTDQSQPTDGSQPWFQVIPILRPLATDLNMTLALAIIVFLSVEIWGIRALGPGYFFKFINAPALGNAHKNPMGVMDFVVGIVEIISEFSRLISLSFRLLGNLFAGGILLGVMTFLIGGVLPVVFMGLEFFVGAIQAYVFAILTVMYGSQAVVSHHHEEEEHHESGHAETAGH